MPFTLDQLLQNGFKPAGDAAPRKQYRLDELMSAGFQPAQQDANPFQPQSFSPDLGTLGANFGAPSVGIQDAVAGRASRIDFEPTTLMERATEDQLLTQRGQQIQQAMFPRMDPPTFMGPSQNPQIYLAPPDPLSGGVQFTTQDPNAIAPQWPDNPLMENPQTYARQQAMAGGQMQPVDPSEIPANLPNDSRVGYYTPAPNLGGPAELVPSIPGVGQPYAHPSYVEQQMLDYAAGMPQHREGQTLAEQGAVDAAAYQYRMNTPYPATRLVNPRHSQAPDKMAAAYNQGLTPPDPVRPADQQRAIGLNNARLGARDWASGAVGMAGRAVQSMDRALSGDSAMAYRDMAQEFADDVRQETNRQRGEVPGSRANLTEDFSGWLYQNGPSIVSSTAPTIAATVLTGGAGGAAMAFTIAGGDAYTRNLNTIEQIKGRGNLTVQDRETAALLATGEAAVISALEKVGVGEMLNGQIVGKVFAAAAKNAKTPAQAARILARADGLVARITSGATVEAITEGLQEIPSAMAEGGLAAAYRGEPIVRGALGNVTPEKIGTASVGGFLMGGAGGGAASLAQRAMRPAQAPATQRQQTQTQEPTPTPQQQSTAQQAPVQRVSVNRLGEERQDKDVRGQIKDMKVRDLSDLPAGTTASVTAIKKLNGEVVSRARLPDGSEVYVRADADALKSYLDRINVVNQPKPKPPGGRITPQARPNIQPDAPTQPRPDAPFMPQVDPDAPTMEDAGRGMERAEQPKQEWPNGEGKTRRVIGPAEGRPPGWFAVGTEGTNRIEYVHQDDLANVIARDRDDLQRNERQKQADEKAKEAEAAKVAELENMDGFAADKPFLIRRKIATTLQQKVGFRGKQVTRKERIRTAIAEGAKIEDGRLYQNDGKVPTSTGEVLENQEYFYSLTKTEADYAAYLQSKKPPQPATPATPTQSEGNEKPEAAAPQPAAKEPWEMTSEEYVEANTVGSPGKSADARRAAERRQSELISEWAKARDDAFIAGKPVADKPQWAVPQQEFVDSTGNDADEHKYVVREALAAGKPVPAEVLKDYPDLAPPTPQPEAAAVETRVFHGTGSKRSGAASAGLGAWFGTDSREYASNYGEVSEQAITLQNPYLMPLSEFRSFDRPEGSTAKGLKASQARRAELEQAGHDGIIVEHRDGSKEYILFNPPEGGGIKPSSSSISPISSIDGLMPSNSAGDDMPTLMDLAGKDSYLATRIKEWRKLDPAARAKSIQEYADAREVDASAVAVEVQGVTPEVIRAIEKKIPEANRYANESLAGVAEPSGQRQVASPSVLPPAWHNAKLDDKWMPVDNRPIDGRSMLPTLVRAKMGAVPAKLTEAVKAATNETLTVAGKLYAPKAVIAEVKTAKQTETKAKMKAAGKKDVEPAAVMATPMESARAEAESTLAEIDDEYLQVSEDAIRSMPGLEAAQQKTVQDIAAKYGVDPKQLESEVLWKPTEGEKESRPSAEAVAFKKASDERVAKKAAKEAAKKAAPKPVPAKPAPAQAEAGKAFDQSGNADLKKDGDAGAIEAMRGFAQRSADFEPQNTVLRDFYDRTARMTGGGMVKTAKELGLRTKDGKTIKTVADALPALQRYVTGYADASPQPKAAPAPSQPKAADPVSDAVFADRVYEAATRAAQAGHVSNLGDQVPIAVAHEEYEKAHGKVPIEDFKRQLVRASGNDALMLASEDRVTPEAFTPQRFDQLLRSKTMIGTSQFHYIRARGQGRFPGAKVPTFSQGGGSADPFAQGSMGGVKQPHEMTRDEFNNSYYQHNILREDATDIGPEGFKSGIGPNVVPVTRGGPAMDVMEKRYGTKAGRSIYIVPKKWVRDTPNGPKIKDGWKPGPYDKLTPTKDNESVYDMVVRAAKDREAARGPQSSGPDPFAQGAKQRAPTPNRIPVDRLPGGQSKKISEIKLDFEQALGHKVYVGKMGGIRRRLGYYRPGDAQTKIKYTGDLDITAHEMAHFLDDAHGIVAAWVNQPTSPFDAELMPAFSGHGSTPPKGHPNPKAYLRAEGVAEWVRAFIVNPTAAVAAAPQFHQHFIQKVPQDVLDGIKAFSDDVRKFAGQGAVGQTMANVRDQFTKPGLKEKLAAPFQKPNIFTTKGWMDQVKVAIQDHLHPVEKGIAEARNLSGKNNLKPSEDPSILMRLLPGFQDKYTEMLDNGLVDSKLNRVTPGGIEWLFEPLDATTAEAFKEDIRNTTALLVAERVLEKGQQAIDDAEAEIAADPTMSVGRQNMIRARARAHANRLAGIGGGIDPDQDVALQAIQELQQNSAAYARAKDAAARYRQWADAALQYAVQKGRYSQAQYQKIKARNQFYAGFQRVIDDMGIELGGRGGLSKRLGSAGQPVRLFKGSTREIESPFVNLLEGTYKMMREADRNEVMDRFADLLRSDRSMYDGPVEELYAIGRQVDSGDPNAIRVWHNGEEQHWQFEAGVHEALKNFGNVEDPNIVMRLLQLPARITRKVITHGPAFIIRNVIRDATTRAMVSETGSKPWAIFYGWKKGEMQDFKLAGGEQFGHYMSSPQAYHSELKRRTKELMGDKSTILMIPGKVLRFWGDTSKRSEMLGRMAEFRSAYKKAKNELGYSDHDAKLYAASHARGILDFAVAGNVVGEINKFVPFTNASVQGVTRMFKSMKKNPRAFAIRWALYSLIPTMLMRGWLKASGDDEEYKTLPPWRRDLFWNFKVGNWWLAIPRPHEIGAMSAMADRMIDAAEGDKKAFEGWGGSALRSIFPFGPEVLAGPMLTEIEMMANYSFFRDYNMVPHYEKDLDISLRKDTERGSRLGKALQWMSGDRIDARQADYWIESRFGSLGTAATAVSDVNREDQGVQTPMLGLTGIRRLPAGGGSRDVNWIEDETKKLGLALTWQMKQFRDLKKVEYAAKSLEERDRAAAAVRAEAARIRQIMEKVMDLPPAERKERLKVLFAKPSAG